jgi:amino acid transporter
MTATTPGTSLDTTPAAKPLAGLRAGALGFPTLLAQSIALISPTMTAVLIVPLAFSYAGNGTWLAYLFATVMLSFVVMNLNQFARRSSAPGSMYTYIGRAFAARGGVLSGWTLLWSYAFIAIAGLTGFAIFVNQFLDSIGVKSHVPDIICFAVSISACWFVAFKDIRISSLLMLVLEALSMAVIIGLCVVVLTKQGSVVDTDQLSVKGVGLGDMNLAVVVCIFSLVGFESATALGGEAKNPLRTIPRAVSWSLAITGLFFVFVSYIEVLATRNHDLKLADLTAPLSSIADAFHVGGLKAPICLGAMVSFFSLTLSCVNAGARILYPMAQHGVFSHHVGNTHARNRTPHIAVTAFAVIVFAVVATMQIFTDTQTTFGDAGTLAAFGFLLVYFMISIAAPVYLRRRGELRPKHVAVLAAALICLLVPTVGSFYPVPPVPVRYFPYYFLLYMLIGVGWLITVSRRKPAVVAEIEADLEASVEGTFEPATAAPDPSPVLPRGLGNEAPA